MVLGEKHTYQRKMLKHFFPNIYTSLQKGRAQLFLGQQLFDCWITSRLEAIDYVIYPSPVFSLEALRIPPEIDPQFEKRCTILLKILQNSDSKHGSQVIWKWGDQNSTFWLDLNSAVKIHWHYNWTWLHYFWKQGRISNFKKKSAIVCIQLANIQLKIHFFPGHHL